MAKYLYIGPPEERGHVPGAGFDDGVLAPDHLERLLARGHVRDLTQPVEAEPADESIAPKPLARMNKTELLALAAELGLDETGTNPELVARIEEARAQR